MNLRKLTFATILFIVIFAQNSYSQENTSFSVSNYLLDLITYLNSGEAEMRQTEIDSFQIEFSPFWETLNESEKKDISYISNYLLEKKVKKSETFLYFLKTAIVLKPKSTTNYTNWINLLVSLSKPENYSTKDIKIYIEQLYMLSVNDFVYWSKSVIWKKDKGLCNFVFDINTNSFKVNFSNVNLECYYSKQDTIKIYSTNGVLDILSNTWKGKNGKVFWDKYGSPQSNVYARLNNYRINVTNAKYTADSVAFKHTELMKTEILGSFSDEASSWAKRNKVYPKFISYKTDFDNIKGNIHYRSGITMNGNNIEYSGTKNKDAEIEYIENGKKLFLAESQLFSESEGKLNSNNAKIYIFIGKNDTIQHPAGKFEFFQNVLNISRIKEGAGNRPFFDTYQRVEIESDAIYWNVKDSLVYFLSQDIKDKYVRSENYYTLQDFEKEKMYETTNPLFEIKRYSTKIQSNTFQANDYSAFAKKEPNAMRQRFIGLWYDGFVDYDTETQQVTVLPKLYNYIEYFFGRKDYDVINISSVGKSHDLKTFFGNLNCVYSRNTNNLTVFGVGGVTLSYEKKTGFLPTNNSVVIKHNRDMYFGGKVRAGLADIQSENFKFDYNKFELSFKKADSLTYTVITPERNPDGSYNLKRLKSTIENVTGKIRIDLAANKSGIKDIPKFPTLTTEDVSYVYYDRKNLYDRKTFFFKNYPFVKDSLLFLYEEKIAIKGILVSGGILPDFEDKLKVQDDYSLGLIHKTPEEGLKLFGGKMTLSSKESSFTSMIKLSNRGLEANGEAKWYNTTIVSKNFSLYSDSIKALADNIEIKRDTTTEGFKYPDVKGKLIITKWDSNKDFISYTTTDTPVEMYEGKVKVKGTLIYKPKSLEGKGTINVGNGTLTSENYTFNDNSFMSEKANMTMKSNTENKVTANVTDMKAYVDINSEKAVFVANSDDSNVAFTENKLVNYPNHMVWDTKNNNLDIDYNLSVYTTKNANQKVLDSAYLVDVCKFDKSIFFEGEGLSKFVSTDIAQKGLTFYGTKANYNSETGMIDSKSVKKIIVADIEVTPTSDVTIGPDGKIGKLYKTTVKARGRHNISDVDITITSKDEYVASSGTYIYYDKNRTSQNIKFDNITYDTDVQATVAHGFVEQFQKFKLSPYFDYYGEVYFNAKNDFLKFKGFSKLIHTCPTKPYWFAFESDINPDSVYIPLASDLHSDLALNKARIFADIMISNDSLGLFSSFMSTDPVGTSESIFSIRDDSYFICYNEEKVRYEIANKEKFADRMNPGEYMELDTRNCIIKGEGKFNYTTALRLDSIGGYGDFRYDMNSKSFTANTLTYLDFFFNKKASDIISDKLNFNYVAGGVNLTQEIYIKNMNNILGVFGAKSLFDDMSLNGGKPKKFPLELDKTLVFSDVKFEWNESSRSFKSVGKIGIGNLNKNMHNKYLDGYIEIRKDRFGDKVFIYFETNPNEWFFFAFSGGIMRTYSSVPEYNKTLEELKDSEMKIRTNKGIFNFMLTNLEAKDGFIYEFTGKHPALQNNSNNNNSNNSNINYDDN